jgi:hypothetical protein
MYAENGTLIKRRPDIPYPVIFRIGHALGIIATLHMQSISDADARPHVFHDGTDHIRFSSYSTKDVYENHDRILRLAAHELHTDCCAILDGAIP